MNVSRLAELIPTSALKFSLKILAHLTSRDTIYNAYPLLKLFRIFFENSEQSFGVNSQTALWPTTYVVASASEHSVSRLLIKNETRKI